MGAAGTEGAGWRGDYALWLEGFVTANLAFLALDIFLAHSSNQFRDPAEYVPLLFSIAAPAVLAAGVAARWRLGRERMWKWIGAIVGWMAIGVGLAGVIFHLDSQFFYEKTLRSLTYAAPFAAPLAYTGLGLLLLVNRMVEEGSAEWARWVMMMALGGFFGNFVLSLTDHATNGFFRQVEWTPVASSAFAVGFLVAAYVGRPAGWYLKLCAAVLAAQAVVGVAGFWMHVEASLRGPGGLWYRIVNGPPLFAPLLLPNLVILGLLGLWVLGKATEAGTA